MDSLIPTTKQLEPRCVNDFLATHNPQVAIFEKQLREWVQAGSSNEQSSRVALAQKITIQEDGLHIFDDDVNMSGHSFLASLPDGLTIHGDAHFNYCHSLSNLGQGFKVLGTLSLRFCSKIKDLPIGLYVGKDLLLHEAAITALPERMVVNRHLKVDGCTDLHHIPSDLVVGGGVSLFRCSGFKTFPKGPQIGRFLSFSFCSNLKHLPSIVVINGSLSLDYCIKLKVLPTKMLKVKHLYLQNCTKLTSFPEQLIVEGDIDIQNCKNLKAFSRQMKALKFCKSGVPQKIHIDGIGIPDYKLPQIEGFEFYRDSEPLDLSNLGLASIPEGDEAVESSAKISK